MLALLLLTLVSGNNVPGPVELRVGYSSYAPFVIADANGRPAGLAVETLIEAARRAKIRLRWVRCGTDVDGALRAAKIDLFPMLTLTPDRLAEFHASEAWWENEAALISLRSSPVRTLSATAGKRIGNRGMPVLRALAQSLFPRSALVTVSETSALVEGLCQGHIDAAFLDVRLLQSQLLKGPASCSEKPLHVMSVPGGNLSQGTIARRQVARFADRLYEQIAEQALDGTLSETASRWSIVSSFQNRHVKDLLEERQRGQIMRLGLLAMSVALILTWFQNQRVRAARRVAEENRQRFDAFMKYTPAITMIRDETGRAVYINEALSGSLPLSPLEVAGQFRSVDAAALASGRCAETTETVTLPSGDLKYFLRLEFPFSNAGGRKFTGSIALDITERRSAEDALRFSQFSIERSPDAILWIDAGETIFYANDAACRSLGYSRAELCGQPVSKIYAESDAWESEGRRDKLRTEGSLWIESSYRTRNGLEFPVEVALYRLEFAGSNFTCSISRDITERRRSERELARQAQHDALTDLPNRRCFESRMESCIAAAELTASGLALFYFDLDRFKLINDTLGHATGDAILTRLAQRVGACMRSGDTLARMGGDEFTLIAPGVDSPEAARSVGERLLACLHDSFEVDGHELLVTASIGISLFPTDGRDSSTLLRNADAAMYEAKRQGKNRQQFFNPAINTSVRERLEIENHLRRALERGELELKYQPEILLGTGETVRYEALLRWNSPQLGSVSPARFIPIAEETGMIVPIGKWVLEEACRHTRALLDAGTRVGVGVNVSSVQFGRADFTNTVVQALEKSGLPPALLDLELTETVVMQGMEEVAQKVAWLRGMGITISIDDFGTGYSSLSYLQTLRIDHLKIDRSFVRDVAFDAHSHSLTEALVALAHGLGMKVVVEGIETAEQLKAVRQMGCDMAQGYFIGYPVSVEPAWELEAAG